MTVIKFTKKPLDERKSTRSELTAKFVKTAPEGEHYDSSSPGLLLRVRSKDKKVWTFVYRIGKNSRKLKLGSYPEMKLKVARERVTEARDLVNKGRDPFAELSAARGGMRFSDLADLFIKEWSRPRKKTWKRDEWMLNEYVKPEWKTLRASDISRERVNKLLAGIPGGTFPNRIRALLHWLFRWAEKQDFVKSNPVEKTFPQPESAPRGRVATDDEIRQLWANGDPVSRFILVTAQRPGECQNLNISEVDQAARVWTIPAERSKNGLAHRVWLSDLAMEILTVPRRLGGRQFPYRPGKTGIEDLRRHDLRRTTATKLAGLGFTPEAIGRLLNHSEKGVTATTYVRYGYDEEKRKLLEAWAVEIQRILKGGSDEE